MKRLFSSIFFAGAILTLWGCEKAAPQETKPLPGADFELFASSAALTPEKTKTTNDGLQTRWAEGDAIKVYHAENGSSETVSDGEFSLVNASEGKFSGNISENLKEGSSYSWYALYPFSTASTLLVGGSAQTQKGNDSMEHLCGAACPLYGAAKDVPFGESPSITMQNLSSVARIIVTNNSGSPLTVESVSLKAQEDIVGQYSIDFTSSRVSYTADGTNVSSQAILSVSEAEAIPNGGSASFYIALKPFTAAAGTPLTISVNGFEKIATPSSDLTFTAGRIKRLYFNYNAGADILPGKDIVALRSSAKWFINEYRAGFGVDAGEYGNTTTFLMSAQFPSWYGRTEFQDEGCTLRIMSGEDENSGYVKDLEHFDSYTWGRKAITADNKILSVYWRTHNGSADNRVPWGVMVVDLSAWDPKAVSIADMDNNATITYGTDTDWHTTCFDLGAYEGKEVVVAIGLYRNYDGKCDYQLPLTHISFGPAKVDGHTALGVGGTAITSLDGWRMNLEEVKSMMPNPRKEFNSCKGALEWSANPWFGVWAGTGHIASEWGLQPVRQNYCTSSCDQGFMLDTRDLAADLSTPVSYFYSKFSIDSDHDKMSFYTRNFSSSVYTYFKVTVIEEDGTVTHLDPSANNAQKAEKAESGCWKFIHESGWSGDLDSCAKFEYDLSGFSGKDVVICIGLFSNGSDEQKLVFCSVKFE